VHFYQYKEQQNEKTTLGFKVYVKDQQVYVGFLKDSSVAARAGLQLHDQILKINKMDLTDINLPEQCSTIKWLTTINEIPTLDITYKRNETTKTLKLILGENAE